MGIIIELFGPPAAGKTTFANALPPALTAMGFSPRLVTSSRPAEKHPKRDLNPAPFARLASSIAAPLSRASKAFGIVPMLFGAGPEDAVGRQLLAILPPASALDALRYRRYMFLLAQFWKQAELEDVVTIVDQGYHQAICSLAALSPGVDEKRIAVALGLVPKPDLLVYLSAPGEVIETRLRHRLGRQAAIERLFEHGLAANLRQIGRASLVCDASVSYGGLFMSISLVASVELDAASMMVAQRISGLVEQRREQMPGLNSRRRTPLVQSGGRIDVSCAADALRLASRSRV